MNDIEKAARLMGLPLSELHDDIGDNGGIERHGWNPRTNKADLSDVIDELGIDVEWDDAHLWPNVVVRKRIGSIFLYSKVWLRDHPTKFSARAEAVMSVVSQLYDAKYGKDGE